MGKKGIVMATFCMKAAGVVVSVCCLFDSTREYCREYLCQGEPEMDVVLSEEDIALEREKSAREDALEGIPVREFSDEYLETLALLRKVTEALFDFDAVLFHGSVIAVDDKAYLFTAKSGTGKSTHTRLWREYLGDRAVMVNDDKPFLKVTPKRILACGNSWNGKHGLGTDIRVPLKAICILERGEENHIRRIHPKDAVHMLLQQSSRPADMGKLEKYLDLIDAIAHKVEFYRLRCNMDQEAARVSYEVMSGKSKDWEI